jgi:hypothetical protein
MKKSFAAGKELSVLNMTRAQAVVVLETYRILLWQ